MSDFSHEVLKVSTGKILQTIGWHSINSTPLEILTDILGQYLSQIAKSTNDYANEFGFVEPNLDHLGLAFRDYHVNLAELEEYVTYVDFAKSPRSLPKYPLQREDHLNFLKPGSKEVITRPVYIHEHLPPMYPLLEVNETEDVLNVKKEEPDAVKLNENAIQIFKRPVEMATGEPLKRPRLFLEEEGRPTREISSVMMTTSGFLSPAREGKLPESRTPLTPIEHAAPPQPKQQQQQQQHHLQQQQQPLPPPTPQQQQPQQTQLTTPNSSVTVNDIIKRSNKTFKKVEKKKEKIGKELFKSVPASAATSTTEDKSKKQTNLKDAIRLKQIKTANAAAVVNNLMMNKTLAAARLKTEKLNTTIIPIPCKQNTTLPQPPPTLTPTPPPLPPPPVTPCPTLPVDKLFSEPDKKKVNIFKKISNVKNEKLDNKGTKIKEEIKMESRESSPDLIIDETAELSNKIHHISNDITIELINPTPNATRSPEKDNKPPTYFDDDSPPGTPSTPKTPEMISESPPLTKEKRKRKDKSKIKKVQKHSSPNRIVMESDAIEIEMEQPKTPEAPVIMKPELPVVSSTVPFPFLPTFGGPGLIPPPLNNQIFPALPFPHLNFHGFGHPPYGIPPVHPGLTLNMMHRPKFEETPKVEEHQSKIHPEKHTTNATITASNSPVVSVNDMPTAPLPLSLPKMEKKNKEHKKEKRDKLKKKNKKEKTKNKAEKKKLKEEKKDKEKLKKEKKGKRKEKEMRENEASVPKLTLKFGSASPRSETPDARKLNIKPVVKQEEPEIDNSEEKREMSPELAKISALVTGQPKPKSNNTVNLNLISNDNIPSSSTDSLYNQMKKSMFKPVSKTRIKEMHKEPLNLGSNVFTPSKYVDSEGNEVWICPACGRQDDGSPMIGCDDCDAWYHWVCVGIQVPPDDNEDWYCRNCIAKKQEVLQNDKKRKRKKKEKKDH